MAFFSKARKAVAIVVAVAVLAPCVLLCGFSASAENTLAGKTALFAGDSIMAGWRDGDGYVENRGWSTRMQKYYDMTVTNAAKAGWSLSTIREDYKGRIRTQLTDNQNNDYDYIILEGGINDIIGDDRNDDAPRTPVLKGAMTASDVFTADSFDVATFAGAMEDLLCCAKTCFPYAKIGYIVTYQTPHAYSTRGQASDTALTAEYFGLAKQICDKWGVSYLDFHTDAYTALFYPNDSASTYFKDDIHLNPAGYDMSVPYVAEWMETLTGGAEPSVPEVVPYDYEDVEAKYYTASEGPIHGNGSGRTVLTDYDHTNGSGQSMQLKMNQTNDDQYARTVVRQYGSDGTTANDYRVMTGRQYVVSFWAYSVEAREVTMRLGTIYSNISVYVGNGDGSNMNPIEAETVVALTAGTWTKVTLTIPFVIGADHLNAEMGENGGYLTLGALTADCNNEDNIQYLYIDDVTVEDKGYQINVSNIIRAPRTAALFCSDSHGAHDPDAADQSGKPSAIYYNQTKDRYYAAMRVFGEYNDTGVHDTLSFEGQGLRVMERGLLVGTDINVTLGSKTLVGKVVVSGKDLNNYWTYNYDSNTLRYSVLLKNIPASRADESFVFRSFVKLGNGHSRLIVYSDIQPGLILRHVYNTICDKNGYTGDNKLLFFGDFNDSPAIQNALPFRDGFDARFTVVYPDDYGTDDGEVSLEDIGSSIVPTGDLTGYTIADNLVNKMDARIGVSHQLVPAEMSQATYEILVGDTGRPESIEAAEELTNNANDFVIRRDESKIAIVANNTEGLELGVQYFINQYLTGPKATLDEDVNYRSSDNWEANKTTYTVGGTRLCNFYIRNEKYPSLLVREAVENLRREAKILFGVTPEPINGAKNDSNLPIAHAMDYDGTRHFDNEIWVGPYQGEVEAIFDGDGDSAPAKNNELTGVEDNGLLQSECGAAGYKIWAEDGKLKVNGGSSYAIYVGVSKLCELLQRDEFDPNAETTGSYDNDYSLMDQYKLIFGDDFNYTGTDEEVANGLLENWSLSSDTTPGMYYYGKDEAGVDLWDEQQRPGIYGDQDGTYYIKDGYLYEITKYAGDNLPYENRNGNGQVWYAGRVTSEKCWSYQYGILEVRIVMGTRNGACSSVWNNAATYAPNGRKLEIDLYENFGQPNLFRANVHAHHASGEDWDGYQYGPRIRINGTNTTSKEAEAMDYYDTFHHIAYRWTKTYIAFYMDGKEFGRLNYDQMNAHEGDDQVMHTQVNLRLANGVGTGGYDGGFNPMSYLTGADDAKNSYKKFKEKQVIDSVYLFQQKDGIFNDKRTDTHN